MNIHIHTSHLRPATIAAMIADLLDAEPINTEAVEALMEQIEESVGYEMAITFLVDAGVQPEMFEH